ncbi:MAG TPA: DUF4105 domain-containing protein [Steroidobacteraceae bacterium]|nr:DUF4105 domain-containing protein [Steroidobacteraceae bacterium]
MTPTIASSLRAAVTVLSSLIIIFPAIWGGFALWYQTAGGQFFKSLCVVLWGAFSFALLTALWQGRITLGVIAFAVALIGLLLWWTHLTPTNDHEWADDVARITTGTVDGSRVTLHNVRNFDWRTQTDCTQRWDTRSYDLDHLRTADMIMSYWKGPVIAHMLISFGFDDGEQVVFSVEVRRQKNQAFSEIGGFFKEFELSIIAADERDVVRLRTNVRGEDVYLYRLQLPQDAMRSLFLGYVGEANSLVDSPRFYNTITVNCTTLVYQMMKRIVGRLPLDYRLLFSGYLPEYVYRVGGLDRRYSLEELRRRGRLTERARISDRSESFSADIRRGIP